MAISPSDVRRWVREAKREDLLKAINGSRQDAISYVIRWHMREPLRDLIVYGQAQFGMSDTKRLRIFHQCNRLFRIQDKIWASQKS